MSKAILLSIKPEWLAKILNGEKTIEVRKKFPKDYVGWVYLYCSKSKPYLLNKLTRDICFWEEKQITADDILNGKVVARFWCDKVSSIWKTTTGVWLCESELSDKLYKGSCLSDIELDRYLKPKALGFNYRYGYAIHISKLEIFDKPKKLNELHKVGFYELLDCIYEEYRDAGYDKDRASSKSWWDAHCEKRIRKPPQNYCYIEGE